MILSILPEPDGATRRMPTWAQALRDNDVRWQSVAQRGVREFKRLAMDDQIPFAFETVFSHWVRQPDGSHASKAEDILQLQAAGYYVVLIFVGLASVDYSILRVQARKQQGGHDVPLAKLQARFSRTQAAVGHASRVADMTWMFDNSRGVDAAFTLARVQMRSRVLYDARDLRYAVDAALREVCSPWLDRVSGPFRPLGTSAAK